MMLAAALSHFRHIYSTLARSCCSLCILTGVIMHNPSNAAAAGRLTFRTSGAGFGITFGDREWYAFMVLPPSHTQYNDVQLSTTVSNSAQRCPTQYNGVQLSTTVSNSICTCTLLILLNTTRFHIIQLDLILP